MRFHLVLSLHDNTKGHRLDVLRPFFLYLLDKEFPALFECMYSFGSFFLLTPEITCQSDAAPGPVCI